VKRQILLVVVVALVTMVADQVVKQWARGSLCAAKCEAKLTSIAWVYPCCRTTGPRVIIPRYLELDYHENPGAAFGMLRSVPGARYILIGVGIVALFLVWSMVRKVQRWRTAANIAFALVAGGAIGNLLDRIYLGRVVDYVVMHWQHKYVWPAYNVADAALVVGVILLILVLGRKPEAAAAKASGKTKRGGK
jgi:signal peptidase II